MKIYIVELVHHFDITRTTEDVSVFTDRDKAEKNFQRQIELYHEFGWVENPERDIDNDTIHPSLRIVKQRGFAAGIDEDLGNFHKGDKSEVVMYETDIIQ